MLCAQDERLRLLVTIPNYKESFDKTCHIKQGFHCVYVYANVPSSEMVKDMLISLTLFATNNNDMLLWTQRMYAHSSGF